MATKPRGRWCKPNLAETQALRRLKSGRPRLFMTYDPRAHGANCDACPLNGNKPCPPKLHSNPRLTVVAEAPGENEEREGEPLIGASGYMLGQALKTYGVNLHTEVFKTNALLCRPSRRLKTKEWQAAIAACRPRLERELSAQPRDTVLALGARALQSLTGKAAITEWMGAPIESTTFDHIQYKVLATIHPAAAMRKPAEIPVFRIHVGRALYLSDGTLPDWVWPSMEFGPDTAGTAPALRRLLAADRVAVDVETDGINPLVAKLTCIGVATETEAISVPWPPLLLETYDAMAELLASDVPKVMQNGQFDSLVLAYNGLPVKAFTFDTMLAHATVAPGLPHKLDYIACVEFHSPRWKQTFRQGKKAKALWTDESSSLQRGQYNAQDAVITALLYRPLSKRLTQCKSGEKLFDQQMVLQDTAMRMKEVGMQTNHNRFAEHESKLLGAMKEASHAFFRLTKGKYQLGAAGQHADLHVLYFEHAKVQPLSYTKEGEPQLDALFLEAQIAGVNPRLAAVSRVLLDFRKAQKLLSTYVHGLDIDKKGCIHPTWKTSGAVTGRWSSSNPNSQNWPKSMRNLIRARKGCMIIGADFSQLELREMALLAADEVLLQYYANNIDVHTETAKALFGVEKVTKEQRDCAKTIEYGFNYNSSDDVSTVWASLHLRYPNITQAQVQRMRRIWLFDQHPKIRTWQLKTLRRAYEEKFIEEPISGRQEHFHDGVIDPNKVLNFPVQSLAAWLMNLATIAVDERLDARRGEFIIASVHDALYVEAPISRVPYVIEALRQGMTQKLQLHGNEIQFTVDIGCGTNWRDLR